MPYQIAAFYKFARLDDFKELRSPLLETCRNLGISGTILLAPEGINGTIAGSETSIGSIVAHLRSDPRLENLVFKFSNAGANPFNRLKVRLKKEIVTLGVPDVDASEKTGQPVPASEWNQLVEDPNVYLLDTRNAYETAIGTFENAVDPKTESFGEIVDFVNEELAQDKGRKIAMFCTGGIRCEKLSAHMLEQGFEKVYQLSGGILKYLEEVPEEESRWKGACFVFDHRVSVEHGLQEGEHTMCHGCGRPITQEDCKTDAYEEGVSCPHCADELPEEKRSALRERQRQVRLAQRRGTGHIGQKI